MGIMVQATALFLGRNIHIIGTANAGGSQAFTKIEGGPGAEQFPPLYIGFYQGRHYVSLGRMENR